MHPIYRFWFTNVDPCLALLALYTQISDPASFLETLTSQASPSPSPEATILIGTISGAYACLFLIQVFALRSRIHDAGLVWAVEAGSAAFEAAKLLGMIRGLSEGGEWTTPVAANAYVTAAVILFRLSYLLQPAKRAA